MGEIMIALISEGCARVYRFVLSPNSGFVLSMLLIVGIRNPRVFPVPVRACAIL